MAGIDLKVPIQVNLPDDWIEQIVNRLRNDPEAEWVEIVRCMDCENWIPGYITDNDDFVPPKCGKYQQMVGHNSDDYCSLAERRNDEGKT